MAVFLIFVKTWPPPEQASLICATIDTVILKISV